MFLDPELALREVYYDEVRTLVVGGYDACKVLDLLKRHVGGVGIGVEVETVLFEAALGHSPACNRGIDAAREEQKAFSCCSYGQSSGTRDGGGVHVDLLADLYAKFLLGVLYLDLHIRISVQHDAAELRFDLVAVHEEALVSAAALDLEGSRSVGKRLVLDQSLGILDNDVPVLLADYGLGETYDSESCLERPDDGFLGAILGNIEVEAPFLSGEGAAVRMDLELDVVLELLLEEVAVEPLQRYLAEADKVKVHAFKLVHILFVFSSRHIVSYFLIPSCPEASLSALQRRSTSSSELR